jgi:hypothetical protein
MPKPPEPKLNVLTQRIEHLKQEHDPLLAKITGDRGMNEQVRASLVAHLKAEEREIVDQIAALSPAVAARYAGARSQAVSVREPLIPLTVGSLRPEPVWPTPRQGPVQAAQRSVPSGLGAARASSADPLRLGSLRRR